MFQYSILSHRLLACEVHFVDDHFSSLVGDTSSCSMQLIDFTNRHTYSMLFFFFCTFYSLATFALCGCDGFCFSSVSVLFAFIS